MNEFNLTTENSGTWGLPNNVISTFNNKHCNISSDGMLLASQLIKKSIICGASEGNIIQI